MIAGSMVALVTPMDAQGGLDWDSLSKLVDFHFRKVRMQSLPSERPVNRQPSVWLSISK
ncbi:hypothetical protein SSTU70S_05472 [Stutzerimonas stutzeri]